MSPGATQAVTEPKATPAEDIGALACSCLLLELETWPKPGLVSLMDSGSHRDMDAALLRRSALFLQPYFTRFAAAGAQGAALADLRAIGIEAEAALLDTTGGVNTHRGAIFGLGLLCAAAGAAPGTSLGTFVKERWGEAIRNGPIALHSHGTRARRLYGAPGARGEAAAGFPTLYTIALPALAQGRALAPHDPEAARVHTVHAIVGVLQDTNLLHRGGALGLAFARASAAGFMRAGGIARPGWRLDAAFIHAEFVKRNLSAGGSADLLAMALFVEAIEGIGPTSSAR